MTCGDKYRYLLVTSDGHTPEDPWSWYAGPGDYDRWYDVTQNIRREVFKRWDWVLSVEDKLSKMESPDPKEVYPKRDQVLWLLQDFAKRLDDLHHVLVEPVADLTWTWEPGINKAIWIATDGACLMEQLDDAVTYYGRPLLPEPAPNKKGEGKKENAGGGYGGAVVTLGLLAGAAYWIRKKARK